MQPLACQAPNGADLVWKHPISPPSLGGLADEQAEHYCKLFPLFIPVDARTNIKNAAH